MENAYRIITDGAGQELVAQLDALTKLITDETLTTVDIAVYTSKAPLTEETGRSVGTKMSSLYTAFKTYIAPSAKKLNHTLTVGATIFDGSENKTVAAATQSASGLLSAADKTKLDGIATGATKIRVKGNAETSYRTGDVNITTANIGLENVDNVKQYSSSNPNFNTANPVMDGTASPGSATTYARSDHKHPTDTSRASTATATTSENGLMSAADKSKLDGVAAGAQENTVLGVKGNAESTYRTGNINLTAANIGAATSNHTHSASDVGAAASNHTHTPASIGAAASSHTHSASDVGAAASNHTHTPASIGAAASNHTHSASDVGAAASNHTHTPASIGALPTSGGTISGSLNVTGSLQRNGSNVHTNATLQFSVSGTTLTITKST